MTKIAEKKASHSLPIMETRTLAMQTENVTNIATQEKVNSALFHMLRGWIWHRFISKPRADLNVFIFGGREFQTAEPENAKLELYRSIRVRGKTWLFDRIVKVLCFWRSHTY